MKITSIKPLARDPSCCIVRGEGGWKATLPVEAVRRLGLEVGGVCDEGVQAEAHAAGLEAAARTEAMRIVGRRAIGSRELHDRLTRKGHEASTVQRIVGQLLDRGVLDDEAYARAAASVVRARKATGSRLLKQKLYQKRLPRGVVEKVVADVERGADPVAEAWALVEKKLRSTTLQKCDTPTRKRRLWGLLARRGFDGNVIGKVLARL